MSKPSQYRSIITATLASVSTLAMSSVAFAQDAEPDEIIAVGIRQSLENALIEQRESANLTEVILAEDIGKLPDQNLAEVLENVTGIQITRTAGVGTGVQIRGTNANRTEVNGVSTVGSGGGRSGINFEDLSAGIIAGVEVIKAPEAQTIEGSVGGTVNLRTIRPLDLKETLATVRVQGENSSLSTEGGWTPRVSGTLGKKWDNASGQEIGVVASISYTEQEASSFRPRVDRDGSLVPNTSVNRDDGFRNDATARPAAQDFDFLGIQFLNQEFENFEYDTLNFAGTIEAKPTDNLKLYFDAVVTDQERRQDSTRVQGSGVSSRAILNTNLPSQFETVNFGSLDGVSIGSIQAALVGTIQPNLDTELFNADGTRADNFDDDDPNLRFNSDTGARVTDSQIFRLGTEWEKGNLSARLEASMSSSDSAGPTLSTQLNFINPNPLTPPDGTSNDNSTPLRYDLTGGALTFGIDFNSPFAPQVSDLTNPANVVLDQVDISNNTQKNSEDALRADFSYDFSDFDSIGGVLSSVDVGYRYNKNQSTFNRRSDRIGGFSRIVNSPSGTLFSELLVAGPDNFGESDGRELAFRNFIIVDPDRAFNDPVGTLAILERALAAHDPNYESDVDLSSNESSFFDIEETTHSLYAQANFEAGIFRGNAGVRYIETEVASTGNTIINGVANLETTTGSYDFILPRFNLVASPTEDIQLRASWGKDIRRPNFSSLNSSITFSNNINSTVNLGNPGLEPETVNSFDVSGEWYFAPAAVLKVGYFNKKRTNLFGSVFTDAGEDANGFLITGDPSCAQGGFFNPIAQGDGIIGALGATGFCTGFNQSVNDPDSTTQQGIEASFQYDLSNHEDSLGSFGWASGFGILANYTHQTFKGGSIVDNVSTRRGIDVFNAINGIYDSANYVNYSRDRGLLDFSEDAYNITGFYEKYGLSARLRYTWRDAFRTLDTAAGASLNSTLGFPVVTSARGQLNGGINYDVTDSLNIGVEAVNITKSGIKQWCVNDGALLCAQGIPDRRIIVGASYTF
ncbi:TonB-dependent receptor [Hellea balneolensis]|uniref:TonB-dependent receptor n=1 Tax=Hellea balneolensis TaxID=287478 RepID=UPI0003F98662|nr:TonB-dependent receptor [Hellea balneolensis]